MNAQSMEWIQDSGGRVTAGFACRVIPFAASLAVIATILVVGCASNSGVFQVAPDTYRVATRATWELGGRAGAMRMALTEATERCKQSGKTLKVLNTTESYGHFEGGRVDMTFTCVPQATQQ